MTDKLHDISISLKHCIWMPEEEKTVQGFAGLFTLYWLAVGHTASDDIVQKNHDHTSPVQPAGTQVAVFLSLVPSVTLHSTKHKEKK